MARSAKPDAGDALPVRCSDDVGFDDANDEATFTRCPNVATTYASSNAPGWDTPRALCASHARIFARMIKKYYPLASVTLSPIGQ